MYSNSCQTSTVHFLCTEGFGYKWCSAIRFEDLIAKKNFTIKCPHADPKEAAFRFQAWVQTDASDTTSKSVHFCYDLAQLET